jgi:hypothetical protein
MKGAVRQEETTNQASGSIRNGESKSTINYSDEKFGSEKRIA